MMVLEGDVQSVLILQCAHSMGLWCNILEPEAKTESSLRGGAHSTPQHSTPLYDQPPPPPNVGGSNIRNNCSSPPE
jgi:hypothetical protein